ncbi:hypothetical protein GHT06_008828 [Daphnia sinensis]|uniref:Uncharacterized protein n=1 Tax=Daphnia sinensis TaxID=1820382 RepID=A0AAD5L2Z1_9CRUS|nr:hypothetical protein GHT06_008828 [Daphnia sinensis]
MTPPNKEKICVIHIVDTSSTEKIKMFDDEKLLKCKNALLVHKFRTNSKFSGLNLPETPDDTQGYHSSCYSKFTAVSSSQIKSAKEKQCNKNSESASAVQDSSSLPGNFHKHLFKAYSIKNSPMFCRYRNSLCNTKQF